MGCETRHAAASIQPAASTEPRAGQCLPERKLAEFSSHEDDEQRSIAQARIGVVQRCLTALESMDPVLLDNDLAGRLKSQAENATAAIEEQGISTPQANQHHNNLRVAVRELASVPSGGVPAQTLAFIADEARAFVDRLRLDVSRLAKTAWSGRRTPATNLGAPCITIPTSWPRTQQFGRTVVLSLVPGRGGPGRVPAPTIGDRRHPRRSQLRVVCPPARTRPIVPVIRRCSPASHSGCTVRQPRSLVRRTPTPTGPLGSAPKS